MDSSSGHGSLVREVLGCVLWFGWLSEKHAPGKGTLLGELGRGEMRQGGGQGRVTQGCDLVFQNRACLGYVYNTGVLQNSLQKLETCLIHGVLYCGEKDYGGKVPFSSHHIKGT